MRLRLARNSFNPCRDASISSRDARTVGFFSYTSRTIDSKLSRWMGWFELTMVPPTIREAGRGREGSRDLGGVAGAARSRGGTLVPARAGALVVATVAAFGVAAPDTAAGAGAGVVAGIPDGVAGASARVTSPTPRPISASRKAQQIERKGVGWKGGKPQMAREARTWCARSLC